MTTIVLTWTAYDVLTGEPLRAACVWRRSDRPADLEAARQYAATLEDGAVHVETRRRWSLAEYRNVGAPTKEGR